jgi:uncharacterized protein YcbX
MPDVTVTALDLYPAKSCRGIPLESARVEPTGLAVGTVRDREWMVVDARGRFVTQRESPDLALVGWSLADGFVAMHVPGREPIVPSREGEARDVTVWHARVRGLDGGDEAAEALSGHLGKPVRLVRFDDRRPRPCNPDYAGDSGATTLFSDGYPVLVIGRASLDDLNERLAARGIGELPMNRFRPNLTVEGLDPYDEDHVDTLVAGPLALKLVKPCTRCEITTTDQASGERGIEPLRTLSTYRRDDRLAGVTFGMNAVVVAGAGSTLRVGEPMSARYRF